MHMHMYYEWGEGVEGFAPSSINRRPSTTRTRAGLHVVESVWSQPRLAQAHPISVGVDARRRWCVGVGVVWVVPVAVESNHC